MPRDESYPKGSVTLRWSSPPDETAQELASGRQAHAKLREEITFPGSSVTHEVLMGENLLGLEILGAQQRKFDVCYIDPPYNTQVRGFRYNDSRGEAEWLTFMQERLARGRELLTDTGTMFVSIDDKHQGVLRVLCDEVFGKSSFHGMLTWVKRAVPVNIGAARHNLQPQLEYVLVYSKCARTEHPGFNTSGGEALPYPHIDDQGRACRYENIVNGGSGAGRRPTLMFEILGVTPPQGKQWKIGEEKAKELLQQDPPRLAVVDGMVKKVAYPGDNDERVRTFWSHLSEVGTAADGKRELSAALGTRVEFDTVKPLSLLREVLSRACPVDGEVLDFFAGSGSTGQAVMEANAADGGSRRFTLLTNDEDGICTQITWPRLKAVATKCAPSTPSTLNLYEVGWSEAE